MAHLAKVNPLFLPGERLGRDEFIALWEQMPELKFAELIDGVVYMPSPLSVEHGDRDHLAHGWVGLVTTRLACGLSCRREFELANAG